MNTKPSSKVLEIAQKWADESAIDLGSFATMAGAGEIQPPEIEKVLEYKRRVVARDAARLIMLRAELKDLSSSI